MIYQDDVIFTFPAAYWVYPFHSENNSILKYTYNRFWADMKIHKHMLKWVHAYLCMQYLGSGVQERCFPYVSPTVVEELAEKM